MLLQALDHELALTLDPKLTKLMFSDKRVSVKPKTPCLFRTPFVLTWKSPSPGDFLGIGAGHFYGKVKFIIYNAF